MDFCSFRLALPAQTDDSIISEQKDAAFAALKLWRDFVDWAHCHDLPLVVGAYALYDKSSRLEKNQGRRQLCLAFMSLTENALNAAKIIEIDRVSPESMTNKLEKLVEYTRELIEGETKLIFLENLTELHGNFFTE